MYSSIFITKPMALLLDCVLGVHGNKTRFKNDQLKQLIKMHSEAALKKIEDEGHFTQDFGLTQTQTKIIEGAFELGQKTAESVTINYDKAFLISTDTPVDKNLLHKLRKKSYSRIPVHY